jgi:SAM-dependent methyltransferase
MFRLFQEFAHRYDLHTPPGHYQHDHALVIREALRVSPTNCRLLDIGCGTGVFLEAAIDAGINAYGIDASPDMVRIARQRVGCDRVQQLRMQDVSDYAAFDVVCALSWTIHYCETGQELDNVFTRCNEALKPGGLLIIQIANEERMTGAVNVDRESGPAGELDDTLFIHQFKPIVGDDHCVSANYVYASKTHRELLCEEHLLRFANPDRIARDMIASGSERVRFVNRDSVSPFVLGTNRQQ